MALTLALVALTVLYPRQSPLSQGESYAETLSQVQGRDFAIIYNTGGFGATTLAQDPQWSGIIEGIAGELEKLGYSYGVLEYQRSHDMVWGFFDEVTALSHGYPNKAQGLIEEINYLLEHDAELRVIITSRSVGAIFSDRVVQSFRDNERVFGIEAGLPSWYGATIEKERVLLINYNGITPDAMAEGDIWEIVIENLRHWPTTSEPPGGAIKILSWYMRVPGHEYTWEQRAVRSRIVDFLESNFAGGG